MRPIKPDIEPVECVCKGSDPKGTTCTSPACRYREKPEAYLFASTWTVKCPVCRKTVGVKCTCTESERDCYYLGLADATNRKVRNWRDIAANICIVGIAFTPLVMAAAGVAWLIKLLWAK